MSDNKNLVPEAELRRRWEGQLNKFTNVVKGYQFRWFVLDPESGTLQYYLLNEENGSSNLCTDDIANNYESESEEDSESEDGTISEKTVRDCPLCKEPIVERNLQVERICSLFYKMLEFREKIS